MPLVRIYVPPVALKILLESPIPLNKVQHAGRHLGYSSHEIWVTTSVLARPHDVVFVGVDVTAEDAEKWVKLKLMCDEIAKALKEATGLSVEVVRGRFDQVSWFATADGQKKYPS